MNYYSYFTELLNGVKNNDENGIGHSFQKMDEELKNIREQSSVRIEREKNQWNDSEAHIRAVKLEEAMDLQMEYQDRLRMFQLASSIQYEQGMEFEFKKMIQNLNDIRKRNSVSIEREKNQWNDPEAHIRAVKSEETMDLFCETQDLLTLHKIAEEANYEKGTEFIENKLKDITPELIDPKLTDNSIHK